MSINVIHDVSTSIMMQKGAETQEVQNIFHTSKPVFAAYQSLPTDIVEKAIHTTFQQEKNQQQEGLWIEVSKKHKPRPQKNKTGHVKQPCTKSTPSQQ